MNPIRFRQAAAVVAERIRKGEVADLARTVVGEDLEVWLEDLAVATITKDANRVKRSMREAARRGASIQLALPGMEHAALPPVVFARDEHGMDIAIPVWLATKAQIRREVSLHRRAVAIQDRVVAGYEETLARLDELGVSDEATGAEILEQFPVALEGGDGDA